MPSYASTRGVSLKALIDKFPDSPQAYAIWDAMMSGDQHIEVGALAGVGKTFTSLQGAGLLSGKSVLMLSFNKPIQMEAQRKIKELFGEGTRIEAKTFNGAGYGATISQWPFLRGKDVNPDRTWQMLPDNMPVMYKSPIRKLIDLCKNTLTEPTRDNLLDLSVDYDIDLFSESGDLLETVCQLTPEIYERSKTPTPDLGIDFNDQVWLPVYWHLPVRRYDMVIVDEAQDLNKCRQQLALMCAGV